MANEKRLIPFGDKVTLDDLPCGTLFAFGDDCIVVKGEYRCDNGLIEAFIIDSGEQFWGGAKTAKEQNELLVQPLEIEEVVHGRWVMKETMIRSPFAKNYYCSECQTEGSPQWKRCPVCEAKMDGGSYETN